jgi:hypothetical protein
MPFLGDKAQRLLFVAAQIAKQINGFKRGHQRALYQFRHVIAHFLQRRSVSAGGINGDGRRPRKRLLAIYRSSGQAAATVPKQTIKGKNWRRKAKICLE